MKLKSVLQIYTVLLLALMIGPAARGDVLLFREENELIMVAALSDGTSISESMTVYRLSDNWFLPLTQLLEGLNVSISVSPELGKAEGDFLESSRHFLLDKSQCQAQFGATVEKYDCALVVIHDDEIFVSSKLLEKWFPLQFKFDSYASEIKVTSPLKFPQQARKERDQKAQNKSSQSSGKPEAYDFFPVPAKNFAGPLLDQQLSASTDRTNGQSYRHDTAASMELFGFETRSFFGGNEQKIDQWSLNFSKKDPNGELLSAMKAREVQAFDVTLPSIPLIAGSTRARGLLISNFSLSQPSHFTSRDFRGPLPSGWEVELYQNDLLVGRQVSDTSTEYEFKDLQLVYGINRFRTVYYGPQGQKREDVETIQIGQSQIQPGKSEYRLALGERVESSGNLTGETRSVLQYQQGLSPNWSVATSYVSTKPDNASGSETTHLGLIGFYGSLSRFFLSLNFATDQAAGNAIEQTVQAPFERGSIGISHTSLSNFKSDLFNFGNNLNLTRVLKLNGTWSFAELLSLRLSAEASQRYFVDHQSTVFVQRSSFKTGEFLWFNTINMDPDASPEKTGQISAVANLSGFEIRPMADYSEKIDALGGSIQKRLSASSTIEVGLRESYREKKSDYHLTLNRSFPGMALSAEASTDSNGDYKMTGLLSYGVAFDPKSKHPAFSPQPQSDQGAASIFVYLDLDQNGIFNVGDQALEGIEILINHNDSYRRTDSTGQVLLTKLPAYEFVDLSISMKTLSDPFYRPTKKGTRIIPRPGNVFQLEFPVIIQSEIDGMIQIQGSQKLRGKSQIEVQLKNSDGQVVATAYSGADGFYLLEKVSTGTYELSLSPAQLKTLGISSQPASYKIEVPASGLVNSTFDFTLSK